MIHFKSHHHNHGETLTIVAYDGDENLGEIELPEPATLEDVVVEFQKLVVGREMVRAFTGGV